MKKTICAILVLCISVSSLFSASVFAEFESETLYDALVEGIRNCERKIDVERFMVDDAEVVKTMKHIYNNNPEFFYLESRYTYSGYSTEQGFEVVTVNVNYTMTGEELEEANTFIKNELNSILRTLPAGLDDYEKALYLHDYLCLNFEYDLTYVSYDIYDMLKMKAGVCQAYALLYDALLERVGIESSAVLNSNHMWNQVKFGDNWYHIDVTWDDPTNDLLGRAGHDYFLVSDELLSETHFDYEAIYKSDDTTYDGFSWHQNFQPIGFAGGESYLIDGFEIKRLGLLDDSCETVYTITEKWHAASGGTYGKCYSGLGSYGDLLIYNNGSSIKSLNPVTGETTHLVSPVIGQNFIYRMYTNGNKAYFLYNTTAEFTKAQLGVIDLPLEPLPCNHNYTYSVIEPTCTESGYTSYVCEYCEYGYDDDYTEPSHIEGEWVTLSDKSKELRCTECQTLLDYQPAPPKEYDVNGDGKFNMFDYILVKSTYFSKTTDPDAISRMDVNGDGKLNMFDYVLVKNAYFKK